MNRLPLEQQFLLVLQTVALVGLCLRIWWTGLYRIYVCFFGYLLVALLETGTLTFVPLRSTLYFNLWMASEGLIVCFYALIVLEVYSNILSGLPGIASVSRRYIQIALALAILASLLLVGLERTPATVLQYFLACYRTIISSLLLFVLSSLVFLVYYPVPLNRNVVIYSIGFAIYLLSKVAALFVDVIRFPRWNREINAAFVGASTACLLLWLFTLNRSGETRTVVVGHLTHKSQERHRRTRTQP